MHRSNRHKSRVEVIDVTSEGETPSFSSNDNHDDEEGINEEADNNGREEENSIPNWNKRTPAMQRELALNKSKGLAEDLFPLKKATSKKKAKHLYDPLDMDELFNDNPDRVLDMACRVPHLESDLENARKNAASLQKQLATLQKMMSKFCKQVADEWKNENSRLQTAEAELNRIRKEIFTAEQAEQKHINELQLVKHRTAFGVQGLSLKLQNTSKGKRQEKADRRDALQERYNVMTSNLGTGEHSSVSASFSGGKARGGYTDGVGGMNGFASQQNLPQQGMYGQPQLGTMLGGSVQGGGGMYGQPQFGTMFGGSVLGGAGGMYDQPQLGTMFGSSMGGGGMFAGGAYGIPPQQQQQQQHFQQQQQLQQQQLFQPQQLFQQPPPPQ
jgi:hypothetical protein